MSTIISKTTISIKPTRIDKSLIKELGELLEKENLKLHYHLDSKTQEVTSNSIQEFIGLEWGQSIEKIVISTGYSTDPHVSIEMDFKESYSRKCFISGKNATWVNGIAIRVNNIFKKYRLNYAPIKTIWFVKIALPVVLTFVMLYPISLSLFLNWKDTAIFILGIGVSLTQGLYYFIQWLFPYFEYGNTTQKFLQKAIWFILVGSGVGVSILLHFLGL
jgi:uncharacterized membrane protein YidH (DUF202 family)